METLFQDFRFGLRMLRKSKGFTAVAILTLALGIGANTSIFSLVNAVLLRPLPYDKPEQLFMVNETWRNSAANVSAGNFGDWKAQSRVFDRIAAIQQTSFNISAGGTPDRVLGERVSTDYFETFRVKPLTGRFFAPEENQPGHDQVVVLSEKLWRSRFAADPEIVGKSIHVDGKPVTVAGVAPKFFDPFAGSDQLWAPIAFTPQQLAEHDSHFLLVVGRLKDGISQQQAQSELDIIAQHEQQLYPVDDAERGIVLMSLTEALVGDVRPVLLMLLGAVGLVLLIGCANVANLQLARARGRARELAIRRALGASDWRIARQILSESLMLSVLGTLAGLVLAEWSTRWLMSASAEDIPRIESAHLDATTLGFAVLLMLLSALLFGLAPAMRARSANLIATFKEQTRGISAAATRDHVRSVIVISQIALALMLLVGAGLLIRSAFLVQRVEFGFDPRGLLVGRVALPPAQYKDPDSLKRSFEGIAERVKAIPGVQSAALVSRAPMRGGSSNGLVPQGRALDPRNVIDSRLRIVSPEYFNVTRITLKQGRLFSDNDQRGGPMVMVINETLAKAAFGSQNPIGKQFACCESGANKQPLWHEVIGVVSDVHAWGLERNVIPEFYLPIKQMPPDSWSWLQNSMDIVLRTDGNPSILVSDFRRSVADVAPDVPVFEVSTLSGTIARSQEQARFNTFLLTLFASIALALAAIGIYGVLAYSVAQRTHEIGIRMALGATRQNVLSLVLRGGLAITLIGVALGAVGAAIATRLLVKFLFQVKPLDVWSFAGGVLVLLFVSLLASYLPARRATRVDPMVALRYE